MGDMADFIYDSMEDYWCNYGEPYEQEDEKLKQIDAYVRARFTALGKECPYCGGAIAEQKHLFKCASCDARVGKAKDGAPFGSLADEELRQARQRAHRVFDSWWKAKKKMNRSKAYENLAKVMEVPLCWAHIALFNKEECDKVVAHYLEKGALNRILK